MNVHGVNSNQVMKGKRQHSRRDKKEIKVTYISSPMKVKTSASNFRALVQELTGQDSNVADAFVQEANGADHEDVNKGSTQQWRVGVFDEGYIPLQQDSWFKPYYSDQPHSRSLLEPLNQHFQYDLLNIDML